MSRTINASLVAALVLVSGAGCGIASAQVGTTITYQGQVKSFGSTVDGPADFRFTLFNAVTGGATVGTQQTKLNVMVDQGLFTTDPDFGFNPYTSDQALWLQIEVRFPAGSGAYAVMGTRQRVTAAPFSASTRGLSVDSTNKVGIGITTPAELLHVNGNIRVANSAVIGGTQGNGASGILTIQATGNVSSFSSATNGGELRLFAGACNVSCVTPPATGTSSGNDVVIAAGDNVFGGTCSSVWNGNIRFLAGDGRPERMRLVGDNGFFGIGRTPTTNILEIAGDASKTTAGAWLANSDARIKTNIETVTNALDTLDKVHLVSFNYTKEYRASHHDIADQRYLNVIAQEFRQVFPDNVKVSNDLLPDGSAILQVDTYPITIYSAAAVQELHGIVKQQGERIASLEGKLAALSGAPQQNASLFSLPAIGVIGLAGLSGMFVARRRNGGGA